MEWHLIQVISDGAATGLEFSPDSPVSIRFDKDRVVLACFLPMPFFKAAKFELIGTGTEIKEIKLKPLRVSASPR